MVREEATYAQHSAADYARYCSLLVLALDAAGFVKATCRSGCMVGRRCHRYNDCSHALPRWSVATPRILHRERLTSNVEIGVTKVVADVVSAITFIDL